MNRKIRYGLLALTFSWHKIRLEPQQFVELVARRFLNHYSGMLSSGHARTSSACDGIRRAEQLVELGHLSDAINVLGKSKGVRAEILRRNVKEQRARFNVGVVPSLPLELVTTKSPRVFSLQTNSVPYTQSGYTVRSVQSMKAMSNAGVAVSTATRLGYPVVVGKMPKANIEIIDGLEFHRLLPRVFPLQFSEEIELAVSLLQEAAEEFCPSVLHTTTDSKNAQVVSRVAKRLSIPWVYEVRGEPEKTWVSKFPRELQDEVLVSERFTALQNKETEAMKAASAVIALSEVSKASLELRGVPSEKIMVIPNAVEREFTDRSYDKAAIRAELGLSERKLVGTVSSIVDYEGLDTLLEAAALNEDFDVVIVGDGAHLQVLKRRAQQLGLRERVQFVGKVPSSEAWKWYAALDVFAVPRKNTEVCRSVTPLKPLMALSLGIPVVGSDLPALNEVTGGNLIAHEPEDAESLAQAIGRAFETSPAERLALRSWAKTRTWEVNGQKFEALFSGRALRNEA